MSDKSDKSMPFVVTDRRKFTPEGEPRPDADPSPEREPRYVEPAPAAAEPARAPAISDAAKSIHMEPAPGAEEEGDLPPAPTAEQMEQSRVAFQATADRLDIAIRAANPGADHPPPMSFEQLVQSVYMQAILQLGGGTQEGQQPQVDLLGARQSIDMLSILLDKTKGNLAGSEQALIDSALFELRLAFLEITQALARSAQQRNAAGPGGLAGPGGAGPGARPGPSIVR